MINEVTTVILVDLLTVFSDGNLTKFDSEADFIFLIVLFSNLAVHLFFLIKSSVLELKNCCKRLKNRNKQRPHGRWVELEKLHEVKNQKNYSLTVVSEREEAESVRS